MNINQYRALKCFPKRRPIWLQKAILRGEILEERLNKQLQIKKEIEKDKTK